MKFKSLIIASLTMGLSISNATSPNSVQYKSNSMIQFNLSNNITNHQYATERFFEEKGVWVFRNQFLPIGRNKEFFGLVTMKLPLKINKIKKVTVEKDQKALTVAGSDYLYGDMLGKVFKNKPLIEIAKQKQIKDYDFDAIKEHAFSSDDNILLKQNLHNNKNELGTEHRAGLTWFEESGEQYLQIALYQIIMRNIYVMGSMSTYLGSQLLFWDK